MLAYEADPPSNEPFDNHVLDRALRAIRVGKRVVHLAPRSFEVIQYLFDRRDRVVTKNELLEALWPGGSGPHALRQEIYSLRRHLAKNGLGECVRTVSHYGYRFEEHGLLGADVKYLAHLDQFQQRALAAAAFFEQRADVSGWSRALFWYEQLAQSHPSVAAVHAGALRALIRLAVRSAIDPDLLAKKVEQHSNALDRLGSDDDEMAILRAVCEGLFGARPQAAIHQLEHSRADLSAPGSREQYRAFLHWYAGAFDEALREQMRALDVAPRDLEMHLRYGEMLMFSGARDAAERQFRFVRQLQGGNGEAAEGLALIMISQSRANDALPYVAEATSARGRALRCVALAQAGRMTEASAEMESLRNEKGVYVSPLLMARCYLALGDDRVFATMLENGRKEAASRWVERENSFWFPSVKEKKTA